MSEQTTGSEAGYADKHDIPLQQLIDCSIVHEFAEAFSLSAIESDLRASIERHCEYCPLCTSLIRGFTQTSMMLAYSAPRFDPPATAKAALFSRLAHVSAPAGESFFVGDTVDVFRTPSLPSATANLMTPADFSTASSAPPESKRSWWSIYAAPLATLPLLLALGIVGFWGINTRVQLNDQTDNVNRLNTRVELLNSQMSTLSEDLNRFDEYLSFRTAKQYIMAPEMPSDSTNANGILLANPRDKQAMLHVSGLNPLYRTYTVVVQLQSGLMRQVAEVDVDSKGSATKVVNLGVQVSELKTVHIRPPMVDTTSDVEVLALQPDSLFTTIGPDLFENTDTRQSP